MQNYPTFLHLNSTCGRGMFFNQILAKMQRQSMRCDQWPDQWSEHRSRNHSSQHAAATKSAVKGIFLLQNTFGRHWYKITTWKKLRMRRHPADLFFLHAFFVQLCTNFVTHNLFNTLLKHVSCEIRLARILLCCYGVMVWMLQTYLLGTNSSPTVCCRKKCIVFSNHELDIYTHTSRPYTVQMLIGFVHERHTAEGTNNAKSWGARIPKKMKMN